MTTHFTNFLDNRFAEELRLIGRIVVEWNKVELTAVGMLSMALHASPPIVLPVLYSIVGNRARLAAIRAALDRAVPDQQTRLAMISSLDEAEKLLVLRNRYAHSVVGTDSDGTHLLLWDMRTGKNHARKAVTIEELRECVDRMLRLQQRLALLGFTAMPDVK